jgi:hypothetical protein
MGPGHPIPIGEGEVGPPRSGFVLRLCIRKADGARGEAALGHGPADTRFCRTRSFCAFQPTLMRPVLVAKTRMTAELRQMSPE